MTLKKYIVLILMLVNISKSISTNITILPKIFHFHDVEKCSTTEETTIYCHIEVLLKPSDAGNPSEVWKAIEDSKKRNIDFYHDEIFYALCLNKSDNVSEEDIKRMVPPQEELQEFTKLGLKSEIVKVKCHNKYHFNIGSYDLVFLYASIWYLTLICISTLYDVTQSRTVNVSGNKYILAFSLKKNLLKLRDTYSRPTFDEFKCIQGIRVLITLHVFLGHSFGGVSMGYIANTELLESMSTSFIARFSTKQFGFLVQNFFLLSAFLLTHNTLEVFHSHKVISMFKYFWLTLINRYLRLIPSMLVVIGFAKSVWYYRWFNLDQPVPNYIFDMFNNCRENWWTSLTFIQNIYRNDKMCDAPTWYLAADTQLYTLTTFILIVMWKYKNLNKAIFLGILFTCGVVLVTINTYINDLEVVLAMSLNEYKLSRFLSKPLFLIAYTATNVQFQTYMVGVAAGYVYFQIKTNLALKKIVLRIWRFCFLVLPNVSIMLCFLDLSPVPKALISGFLKPLYALGLVIGILGIAQKPNSVIRSFLESKPIVFMGNFVYCIYLVGSLTLVTETHQKLFNATFTNIFLEIFKCVLTGIPSGVLLHILVEMPVAEIQGFLIPKIRKKNKEL